LTYYFNIMSEPNFLLYKKSKSVNNQPDEIIQGWNNVQQFLKENSGNDKYGFDGHYISIAEKDYYVVEENVETAPKRQISASKTIKTRSIQKVEYLKDIYQSF